MVTNEKYAGYGLNEKPDEVEFYITNPVNKEKSNFWQWNPNIFFS
jgi:hypothetical protein